MYHTKCIYRAIISNVTIIGDRRTSEGSGLVKELLRASILVDFCGVKKDVVNLKF